METIGFIAILLVLIVGGTVLKRYARGKAAAAGAQRNTSKGFAVATKISESIVLAAPVEVALALVGPVLAQVRGVVQTGTHRWAQAKWALDEALRYELVETPAGAELFVPQVIESTTGIDGERTWRKIRAEVAAAAAAAGVATAPGRRPLQRAGFDGENNPVWQVA